MDPVSMCTRNSAIDTVVLSSMCVTAAHLSIVIIIVSYCVRSQNIPFSLMGFIDLFNGWQKNIGFIFVSN